MDGAGVSLSETVDLTADRLHGDVEITAVGMSARASENQMLHEMRDPILLERFVARAGANHERTRHRVDVGKSQHEDREPVGESVPNELEHGSITLGSTDSRQRGLTAKPPKFLMKSPSSRKSSCQVADRADVPRY